jgi:hypothetical protein
MIDEVKALRVEVASLTTQRDAVRMVCAEMRRERDALKETLNEINLLCLDVPNDGADWRKLVGGQGAQGALRRSGVEDQVITPRGALLDVMAIDDLVERRKAVIKWFDTWIAILGADMITSRLAVIGSKDPQGMMAIENENLVRALFNVLVKDGARERVLQLADLGKDEHGNFLTRIELRLLRFPHDP